jgi:murein DD-endopeptidase MepM/ murein hydrolase activator NlpD
MKFIIVDNRTGKHRSFTANSLVLGLTIAGLLGIPALTGYLSYQHGLGDAGLNNQLVDRWRDVLKAQQEDIKSTKTVAQESLEASAVRLAQLQARIVRLDALGERLTRVAKLEEGEFDFSQPPALGGPLKESVSGNSDLPDYMQLLDQLGTDIESREQQLSVLETLLVSRKMQKDVFIAGRPVQKGWLSSRFGTRNDPITGKRAWHSGVDFAGKDGSSVIAVAAGVVVYAAPRSGYGLLVELNHGSGFKTLYGHHKKLHVRVGDIVKKGQVIGSMGSSGRSTGPHVHFEVYKNGRVVDPASYIHRASR